VSRKKFLKEFEKGDNIKCCEILFPLCDKVTISYALLGLIKSTPLRVHRLKLEQFEKTLEKLFSDSVNKDVLEIIKHEYVKTGSMLGGMLFRILAGTRLEDRYNYVEVVRRIEVYYKGKSNINKFLMELASDVWPENNLMGAIYG